MKQTKETKITRIWLLMFILANIIVFMCSLIQKSTILLIISSMAGVSYALLIAKEKRIAFILGAINVSTYGYLLLKQQVYGGVFYNIVYSLPMMIYGYFSWRKEDKKQVSNVKTLSKNVKIVLIIVFTIAIIIYAILLKNLGGNKVILDSITTILGFLGIYLMTNKYFEQWIVWIISNTANLILWALLSIENIQNLPMLIMWSIYLINSVYGHKTWKNKV